MSTHSSNLVQNIPWGVTKELDMSELLNNNDNYFNMAMSVHRLAVCKVHIWTLPISNYMI